MRTHFRPLLLTEHNDGDFSFGQILLIPQVLVCCQKDFETFCFRGIQQFAVLESAPPCCAAVRTSWSLRYCSIGLGVAWSNRMRISIAPMEHRRVTDPSCGLQTRSRLLPGPGRGRRTSRECYRNWPLLRDSRKLRRPACACLSIPRRRSICRVRSLPRDNATNPDLPYCLLSKHMGLAVFESTGQFKGRRTGVSALHSPV
jgi:hypothetical protein